jgi:hypothetical protein
MTDNYSPNGADYDGVLAHLEDKVAKGQALTPAEFALVKGVDPVPHVAEKIEKGLDLTPAENWVVDMVKAMDSEKPEEAGEPGEQDDEDKAPDTHGGKDEGDEDEEEVEKSFDSAVAESDVMRKGIEMSPFLYEFANAINTALNGVEARLTKSLHDSLGAFADVLDKRDSAQGEFFKSLAESVVGIGELAKSQAEGVAPQAARAPKSAGLAPMNKSIGGIVADTNSLQKSQILDAMVDMVKSNKLSQTDVIQYEHTGHLPANVQAAVTEFLSGKR